MPPSCPNPRRSAPFLALTALLALAGCGGDTAGNSAQANDAAIPVPPEAGRIVHTIAPGARAHAGLAALLDADAARGRAVMAAAPRTSQAARGWRKDWRVTATTRRLVAVAAERIAPAGDGVTMRTDAILWDRIGERPLTAERLFTDPVAALDLIETHFCAALEERRAAEQGFDRARSPCPGVEAGHFAWEAGGGPLITAVAAHVPAEKLGETGPGYRIAVPIPAEILPLIRTDYRADFGAGR